MTMKAASRLRRMECYAGVMSFSARLENDTRTSMPKSAFKDTEL